MLDVTPLLPGLLDTAGEEDGDREDKISRNSRVPAG